MIYGDVIHSLQLKFRGRTRGVNCSAERANSFLKELLDDAAGLALGEIHGVYCFPDYVRRNADILAEAGVTRFYTEIFPASANPLLETWQDEGDPRPVVDFINGRQYSYASEQWLYYWNMMLAVKEAGIRIVGVDERPDMHKNQTVSMAHRNDLIVERIASDQKQFDMSEKFVFYGGRDHARDHAEGVPGVAARMAIPRLLMEIGDYCIVRNPEIRAEHVLFIPYHKQQVAHFRGPQVPHRHVPYPHF